MIGEERRILAEEEKNALDKYQDINKGISERIIYLSLAIIASIYVISEKYGFDIWRLIALLGFILTIGIHIFSCICSSKHYEYYLDNKINTLDHKESVWGICAEWLYWVFIIAFIISMALFIIPLTIRIIEIIGTNNVKKIAEFKALKGI